MSKFYTHKVSERVYEEFKRRGLKQVTVPTYAEVLDKLQSLDFRLSIAQIEGANLVSVIIKKGNRIRCPRRNNSFFEAMDDAIFICFELMDNENVR